MSTKVKIIDCDGTLYFETMGVRHLYMGKDGINMYGVAVDSVPADILLQCELHNFEVAREMAKDQHLPLNYAAMHSFDLTAVSEYITPVVAAPSVTHTDCRSPEGVVVGLIDGIIAMCRVIRSKPMDVNSAAVQEALKDLQQDEDVKWVMDQALQDWSFGEEPPHPLAHRLADALQRQVKIIVAEGEGWPNDAVYMTESLNHTWPMGWEKEFHKNYFPTKEALQDYLDTQKEWAKSEDNEVKITVHEWDLGPNLIADHHFK